MPSVSEDGQATQPPDGRAQGKPSARERGKMRRRLRRQQRVREALLLDLGALVFELHRHGRREPELLQAKAAELTAVDEEVRALADALGTGHTLPQLVAPGIAGSCERCGALLTSDSRFCSSCGTATGLALTAEPEMAEEVPVELASDGDGDEESLEEAEPAEAELPTEEQAALEAGELQPEPEAEAEPAPEAEAEPEPEPEPEAEAEPEPEPEPEAAVPPEPKPWPAADPHRRETAPARGADLFEDIGKAVRTGIRRGRDWVERRRSQS